MGLIRAALNSVGGVLADQYKEFFYCDAIDKDVLVVKGQKRVTGRSQNNGTDNIISNGSGIAVADGQCMIIVDQGKVVEVCAEPGEFTYDSSSEPSVFSGSLGTSLLESFKAVGKRFSYGGDTGKDQRVYYFNTKEIIDNKVGTPSPVPFRVVDKNINLDIDLGLRLNGVYSYRITDPLMFYTNVCGNVDGEYSRSEIDGQLKSEVLSALQPAFAKISEMGVRYSAITAHTAELEQALRDCLADKWTARRGITIETFNVNSVNVNAEDEAMIKQLQRNAVLRDPTMAAATLVGAQSQAMQDAANNTAGAMNGFIGMNMAQQAGGMNAQSLFAMGQQQPQQPVQQAPVANGWTCSCGTVNTGNFCTNCGSGKPAPAGTWTCSCGTVNSGNFCTNCGSRRA